MALYPRRPVPVKREAEHKINHYITATEVRLVGDNIEPGVYSLRDAVKMAQDQGLDLVQIADTATPPVCKVIDYSKFLYDKKKREKELKSKTSKNVVKEIRFTPNTDDHDFEFKTKHAENFLKEGAKVKAWVQFRGRNILFRDRGELLLLKFIERLNDIGIAEMLPKLEGNRMMTIINPRNANQKKKV